MDARWQYATFFALALVALAFTVVLGPASNVYFRRYFGALNPALVVIGASILGAAALWVLRSRYGFEILLGRDTLRGVAFAAVCATLLALAVILADIFLRYPEHMNVPVPPALLFYPAIGFVAEIVFHVLPLALLLVALTPFSGQLGADRTVWAAIVLVALVEPIFQVAFAERPLTWRTAYTGLHVFILALLQLYVFRRYDFMAMYAFRLIYYAYWHIAWGVIRLQLLF